MTAVVAYKWASNPQDASVGADGVVDWSRAKSAISDYDPVSIQLGRNVADALGGELVGVSVGTSAVASSMAKKGAMSRGMDRGIVVADDDVAGWNLTQVGEALAKLVNEVDDVDIVLTGDASVDENAKMVPTIIAGYLGWPCFQEVKAVEKTEDGWKVTQGLTGGTRTIDVTGPIVVSVATDAVAAKVPGMKDIMAAGKKSVEEKALADLGLSAAGVEIAGRTKPDRKARKNVVFEGDDAAAQLVAALKADGLV